MSEMDAMDAGLPSAAELAAVNRALQSELDARKKSEETMRESESRFRAAFENAPFEFWVRDAEGRRLMQNATFTNHWGDQSGKRIEDTDIPEEVAAIWQANNRRAYAGEVVVGDVEYTFNGERRSYHNVISPFRVDGVVRGILGFNIDVTDRKRAEEQLEMLNQSLERRVAERTQVIQMLHDVTSMANQSQNARHAIEHCLEQLAAHNGWSFGHALLPAADDPDELVPAYVYYHEDSDRFRRFREATLGMRLRRGEGMAGRVFVSGQAQWAQDLSRDLGGCRAALAEEMGICTAIAFPVLVGEDVACVFEFFSDRVLSPDEDVSDALVNVGMQVGRVLERAKFEEHLLTTAEDVQRRIAQDLHDDVGQELTGLGLKMETLAEMLASADSPAAGLAAGIVDALDRTRSKVRVLSRRLLPPELEEGLLAGALERLAITTTTGSRIACTLRCSHADSVFDSHAAMHLYRIAQEAVCNAVRHSGARNIQITLDWGNGETALTVEDDGKGMSRDASRAGGMGLRTMRYRAGLIGGKLEVGPGAGGGVRVACRLSPRNVGLDV